MENVKMIILLIVMLNWDYVISQTSEVGNYNCETRIDFEKYPHPENCNRFYICYKRVSHLMICGDRNWFSYSQQACVNSVDDCVAGSIIVDNPVSDDPTDDNPIGDDPVGDDPTDDNPIGDDPVDDDPADDNPTGDDPIGDDPADDNPIGDDPVVDDPIDDNPIGDDPVGDDPADDNPVEDDTLGDDPADDNPIGDDPEYDDPAINDDPADDDPIFDDPIFDPSDTATDTNIAEDEIMSKLQDDMAQDDVTIVSINRAYPIVVNLDKLPAWNEKWNL